MLDVGTRFSVGRAMLIDLTSTAGGVSAEGAIGESSEVQVVGSNEI